MSKLQDNTPQPSESPQETGAPAGPKTQWNRFVEGWNETFPDKISVMIFFMIAFAALFLFGRVVVRMRYLFGI
ncbi:hypothetical protein [Methylocapsa palsarum]|uniref:Uncharacterized protein n=1 Tax=Methylocapsa palsarum TaxID=1612308 RepID=A0A1I4C7A4_9HYPH|nr:hypothetical protein [Methylocapsa palsarum]SFK76159.1 hypothetical protein SAMN05444581_11854 [Methylocapsa palsarum]